MNSTSNNFYVQKQGQWLKFFKNIIDNKNVQKLMVQKYIPKENFLKIRDKIHHNFEDLLPQIPDYGSKKITQLSTFMVQTAFSIALYRALKEEGFQLHTIGQIIYEIAEVFYENLNAFFKYFLKKSYFSNRVQRNYQKMLEQRNKHPIDPEDYHCAFVEGDKKNFLFGVDYTVCGGLNFLKSQKALEIAPYLCLCDYAMYKALNMGFIRTENLAIGGSKCAFRFYKDYPTQLGWPPEQLEEYKNYKFK